MPALTEPSPAVVLRRISRDNDKLLVLLTRKWGKVRALARGSARPSRWSGRLEPLVVLEASFARSRSGLLKLTTASFIESLAEGFQTPKAARALSPFLRLLLSRFPYDHPDEVVYDVFLKVLRHLPESLYPEDLYWVFSGLVLSRFGGLALNPHPSPDLIPEVASSGLDPKARQTLKTAVMTGWKTALHLDEPGFFLP